MRQSFILLVISSFQIFILSCKKEPYISEYYNIKGYVIGKETCNIDDTKDYWLIDFTYGAANAKIGDTVVINGNSYTNVLKTKELAGQLKVIGLKVSIDYNIIGNAKILTSGCTSSAPVVYLLKDFSILNQGEIR